jgi:hypothetical protein
MVEGESEAFYIGAVLSAFDRAEAVDIDLNMFSVQWAGNSRDFAPMARLLVDEGREVVALVDGDQGGNDLRRGIDRLNAAIDRGEFLLAKRIPVLQLPQNSSIEDILPSRENYLKAVADAAEELVNKNFKQKSEEYPGSRAEMMRLLTADKGNKTLGRHIEEITGRWFDDGDAISKIAIARHYSVWLEGASLKNLGITDVPNAILSVIDGLGSPEKAPTGQSSTKLKLKSTLPEPNIALFPVKARVFPEGKSTGHSFYRRRSILTTGFCFFDAVDVIPGGCAFEGVVYVVDVLDAFGAEPIAEGFDAFFGVDGDAVFPGGAAAEDSVELDARLGGEFEGLVELGVADSG